MHESLVHQEQASFNLRYTNEMSLQIDSHQQLSWVSTRKEAFA